MRMQRDFAYEMVDVYTELWVAQQYLRVVVQIIEVLHDLYPDVAVPMEEKLAGIENSALPEEVDASELIKALPLTDVHLQTMSQFVTRLRGLREEYRDVAPPLRAVGA